MSDATRAAIEQALTYFQVAIEDARRLGQGDPRSLDSGAASDLVKVSEAADHIREVIGLLQETVDCGDLRSHALLATLNRFALDTSNVAFKLGGEVLLALEQREEPSHA